MSVDESNGTPFEVLAPEKPDFRRRGRRAEVDLSRIDKLPPHDIASEQGILGCILLDPVHALDECEGKIAEQDFYDLRHQALFARMLVLRSSDVGIDPVTLQNSLNDARQLEAVGGFAYLTALPDAVPSAANLPYYLAIVLEKSALRKALQSASNAIAKIHEAGDNADAVLAEIEVGFEEVRGMRQRASEGRIVQAKAVVGQYIQWQEKRVETKGALSGMSTGFPDFDELTDGLQLGEMALIAARPGAGKSSIALDIAAHVALAAEPTPVLFISIEMSSVSLLRRLASSTGRVLADHMKKGRLTDSELRRITRAASQIAKSPLHFVDAIGGITCGEVSGLIASARKKLGVKLVIVDYIQKVRPTRTHTRRDLEVSEVSETLRGAAHRNHIALLCLAQLRRDIDREKNARPNLASLRESASLEQDSDLVSFLHRNRSGDEGIDPNATELIVGKQRDGAIGAAHLLFLPEFCHFVSAAKVEPATQTPAPRQKHWYEGD